MRELRCAGNKLHGMVVDDEEPKPQGIVEFRCTSHWCGYRPKSVVVLHRFNLETGECNTRQFRDPHHQMKGE